MIVVPPPPRRFSVKIFIEIQFLSFGNPWLL